jgi:hypothetical protein
MHRLLGSVAQSPPMDQPTRWALEPRGQGVDRSCDILQGEHSMGVALVVELRMDAINPLTYF